MTAEKIIMCEPAEPVIELSEAQKEFLAICDAEFVNRYTERDEEFTRQKARSNTPPIIDPWYNKPKRNFNWTDRRGEGSRRHHNWEGRHERWRNRSSGDQYRHGHHGNGYRPY